MNIGNVLLQISNAYDNYDYMVLRHIADSLVIQIESMEETIEILEKECSEVEMLREEIADLERHIEDFNDNVRKLKNKKITIDEFFELYG